MTGCMAINRIFILYFLFFIFNYLLILPQNVDYLTKYIYVTNERYLGEMLKIFDI